MHPPSIPRPEAAAKPNAPPRLSAAHGLLGGPLLPSGPDGVDQEVVAQDPGFIASGHGAKPQSTAPREGNSTPLIADCGLQGTASSPSSTITICNTSQATGTLPIRDLRCQIWDVRRVLLFSTLYLLSSVFYLLCSRL